MTGFTFTISRKEDEVIICLKGTLNAPNSTELIADQEKELNDPSVKNVTWDVGELNLVASAGLRVMMAAIKVCMGRGGRFSLVSPSESISQVIRISGLDKYLTIRDTLD